jgi:1-acyl-sn-glycerol-3-phosphate acyltransferase
MSYFWVPFRVGYKIYYLILFSVSLIVLYPIFYFFLSKPERFPKAFLAMRFWAFIIQFFAGVPLKITRKSALPKNSAYIICPNHSSFMDIPCSYVLFKDYFIYTGKKEIEKWPLFHIFYTKGMNITVDRHSKMGAYKAFKRASEEIDRGHPILMFPEGTISKVAPSLTTFKSGPFSLAIKKQIPIVPVTFVTNWKRLQRKSFFSGLAGPGVSEIIVHEPCSTEGLSADDVAFLQNKVKQIINAPLKERFGTELPD